MSLSESSPALQMIEYKKRKLTEANGSMIRERRKSKSQKDLSSAQIHSCMLFQKKHTENDASNQI